MYRFAPTISFSTLLGITFQSVERTQYDDGDSIMFLGGSDGKSYILAHAQDCCESVSIEDMSGDLADLSGSPILLAEESSNSYDAPSGTYTWTFYRIGTIKGTVVLRWYGTSNGYYSESVNLYEVPESSVADD